MPKIDGPSSPEEAVGLAAQDLLLCPSPGNHIWCVYDAETGERALVRAEDVLPPGLCQALAVVLGHEMDDAETPRDTSGVDDADRSDSQEKAPNERAEPPLPPGQMLLHAEMDSSSRETRVDTEWEDALDATGKAEVLSHLGALPWADVEGYMATVDEALRLAVDATSRDFLRWENEGLELGFGDEFSVAPERVDSLPDEWRLAYVARLVASAAMVYGIQGRQVALAPESRRPEPRLILRTLNAIVSRSR